MSKYTRWLVFILSGPFLNRYPKQDSVGWHWECWIELHRASNNHTDQPRKHKSAQSLTALKTRNFTSFCHFPPDSSTLPQSALPRGNLCLSRLCIHFICNHTLPPKLALYSVWVWGCTKRVRSTPGTGIHVSPPTSSRHRFPLTVAV